MSYDFRQGRKWRSRRLEILARDGRRCRYCGRPANEVDHRVRVADGGAWFDPANLVACCRRCNARRANVSASSVTVFKPRQSISLAFDAVHTHRSRYAPLTGDYSRRETDARRSA